LKASCFAFRVALCFASARSMWMEGVTIFRVRAERIADLPFVYDRG
jgi:hypothetical protein